MWVKYSRDKRYYISADHRLDHKQSTRWDGDGQGGLEKSLASPQNLFSRQTQTTPLQRKRSFPHKLGVNEKFALEFRCFRVWVKYSRNKRYYISADHRLDHKQSTPIHGHESQTIPIGYLITNTHTRNLSRKQTNGNKTYKVKK